MLKLVPMFLKLADGEIFDYDLEFLQELTALIDTNLGQLEARASSLPNPDAFGIYDSAEYIVGVGFVACQGYLTATYGPLQIRKDEALKMGPCHPGGQTVAAVINHAANFWKHHEEWALNPNSAAERRTLAALATVAEIDDTDNPLLSTLVSLVTPLPRRFQALLPQLEAWRNALAA